MRRMRQIIAATTTAGATALAASALAQTPVSVLPPVRSPAPIPTSAPQAYPVGPVVSPRPGTGIGSPPLNLRLGVNPTPSILPALPEAEDRLLPINLATALQLSNARPIDVQIASRQVSLAVKQLERSRLQWVPNIVTGVDYFRHDGGQQNFAGDIVRSSRSSIAVGVGPNVVFSGADAFYGPLAAKQDLRARQASRQAAENDTTLAVAEAYFSVQQARGELAGALLVARKAEEVAAKAEQLAEGLAPPLEAGRARVEQARRQQAVSVARERWRNASAELVRILRLEPGTLVDPVEPPYLSVSVIDETQSLDALIPIGLSTRPELAGQQAVVQAALTRLKQEKIRPLVPSLALRSAATNPSGSIGFGGFAGGPNDRISNWGGRFDMDLQVLWEFSALGFGNKVRVGERRIEHQTATLELFRTQDRIAAEISQAYAQAKAATERMTSAEPALREAIELVEKSVSGMSQTRRIGEINTLIVRPQEVVAAVQALGQANADFYSAVSDYNKAQFRLYRALGHPANCLASVVPGSETLNRLGYASSGPRISGTHTPPNVSVFPSRSGSAPAPLPAPGNTTVARPAFLPSTPAGAPTPNELRPYPPRPAPQPMPSVAPPPAYLPAIPTDRTPQLPIQDVPPIPGLPAIPGQSQWQSPPAHWPPVAVEMFYQAKNRPAEVNSGLQQTAWTTPEATRPGDLPPLPTPAPKPTDLPAASPPQPVGELPGRNTGLVPIAETPPARPAPAPKPNSNQNPTVIPPAAGKSDLPKPTPAPEPVITWTKAPQK